jgi:hypothetical protein
MSLLEIITLLNDISSSIKKSGVYYPWADASGLAFPVVT